VPELDITVEDHRATVQDGLTGRGFLAAYFPGLRRHDLEAPLLTLRTSAVRPKREQERAGEPND
jgi:hypothetical protein